MERRIDISNLEETIPTNLGVSSIKKLRDRFNYLNNTNYKTISQISKRLGTNNLQAQFDLAKQYNTFVTNKQNIKKTFNRTLPTEAKKLFKPTEKPEKVVNRLGFSDHSYSF